ncbi:PAS domain S-box protein [Leptolyngbya sp. AN02str]|uniref:PAS domain S-box protein n=1 Tax=Leptolyngbya sp. AN02str TaxID=3423363 RepID=UPI003D31A56F
MAKSDRTVLVIDGFHGTADTYQGLLKQIAEVSYQVLVEPLGSQGLALLQSQDVGAILLEARSIGARGLGEVRALTAELGKRCPPIVVIGDNDAGLAVQAMKAGAADYLVIDQMTAESLHQAISTAMASGDVADGDAADGNAALVRSHPVTSSDRCVAKERYRALFNSIREGFCILQMIFDEAQRPIDYRYLEINSVFEEQTGLKNVLGKRVRELVPDLEPFWFEIYGTVALTGEPVHFVDHARAMGRWFEVNAFRIDEPHEHRVGLLFKDITKRKEAEAIVAADLRDTQLLRDLGERLSTEANIQSLYDEIVAAAIALTHAHAGAVQMWDDATQELVLLASQGFAPSLVEQFHRLDASSNTSCGQALRSGDRTIVDCGGVEQGKPDGALRLLVDAGYRCAQSTPLIARSGKLLGMVSTHWHESYQPSDRELRFLDLLARQAADLIEQRLAEQVLRQSEEKYRLLFTEMDEGYCIAEVIFDEYDNAVDYRIIDTNPQFERLTGLSRELALSGKTIRTLAPELEEHWYQIYGQVARTGEPIRFEQYAEGWGRWYDVYAFRVEEPEKRRVAILYNDITNRKRTETQLRSSEEWLRLASHAAQFGIYEFLPETRQVKWSPLLKTMHGLPEDAEVTCELFAELFHPADRDKALRYLEESVQPDAPSSYEYEFRIVRRTDGEVRWILDKGQVFFEGEGAQRRAMRVVGVAQDITERKQAEIQLYDSEARYRALVDQAVVGVAYAVVGENSLLSNQQYCDITGYTAEELQHVRMHDITHPDDLPYNAELYDRLITDGTPFEIEKRYIRKDGDIVWVNNSVSLVRDFEGNPKFVLAIVLDITARKQAEEAAREAAADFQAIANLVPDLLWRNDASGHSSWFNQRWLDYTGQTMEEAQGYGWLAAIHPDDQAESLAKFQAAVEQCAPLRDQHRIRGTDGNYRWFLIQAEPALDTDGRITQWFGAASDIHDQQVAILALQESERQLEERTALLERAQRVGKMGHWVYDAASHDLFWSIEARRIMVGESEFELSYESAASLVHPDDLPQLQEAMTGAIAEQRPLEAEHRIIRPDGIERTVYVEADLEFDEAGQMIRMFGIVSDITERKQAEEALRQSEEQFRLFVTASSDTVYKMSADWSEMRHLEGKDFLVSSGAFNYTWLDAYIPLEDQANVLLAVQEAVRHKTTFELEHRVIRLDGSIGWTFSRAVPLLNEQGEIVEWLGTASDVSDRKWAEATLRESEERFRLMTNVVPQMVWITDSSGNVEFFNKQWNDYTGTVGIPQTAQDVCDHFIHPDDAERTMEVFAGAQQAGTTFSVEHRIRSATGEYRWFLVRAEPYFDPGTGEIVRWFGTSTDIHDRKLTEVTLRDSEERFRLMADAVPQIVWIANSAGYYEFFNQQWESYTGIPFGPELTAEMVSDCVHPDDIPLAQELFQQAAAAGSTYTVEHRVRSASGEYRWFLARAQPSRDPVTGDIVRWFGTSTDIHDLKMAETQMRASEERLRLASDAAIFGIYEYIPSTNQLNWSPLLKSFYGLPEDATITFDQFFEFIHPDDRPNMLAMTEQYTQNKKSGSYEHLFRIVRTDGEVRWQLDRGRLFFTGEGEHRQIDRVIGITQDVTERKRNEEQARRAAELDAFRVTLSDALRSLLDPGEIQYQASRVVGEYMGVDRVFYAEVDTDATGGYFNIKPNYHKPTVPDIAGRYWVEDFTTVSFVEMLAGHTLVVNNVEQEPRFTEAERQLNLEVQAQAFICVPLTKEGRLIAIFAVHQTEPRNWTDDEIALMEETAERTWSVVERAMVEQALRDSEERQAYLLKLSDALRSLSSADEIKAVASQVLGEHLQVDRAYYAEVEPDDEHIVNPDNYYSSDRVPSIAGRHRIRDYSAYVFQELRANRPIIISDTQTVPADSEAERAAYQAIHVGAAIAYPLVKAGRLLATLGVTQATPRQWTETEVALVRETADRTWAAVERARTEAALRESEGRYRNLFTSIDEGYLLSEVILDEYNQPVDILYLDANPSAIAMLGQDFTGRRLSEIELDYDKPYWCELFGRVVRTGQGERLEGYSEPHNCWFDFYMFQAGEPGSNRVASVFQDITRRKRREANLSLMSDIVEDLSRLSTVDEIFQVVGAKLGAHLNLATCHFAEIDEAGDRSTVSEGWRVPEVPDISGVYRMSEFFDVEVKHCLRAGQTFIIRDAQNDARLNRAGYADLGIAAGVTVPFHHAGEWRYVMVVTTSHVRDWRDDEIELIQDLANRIFPRLERARAEAALRLSEEKYRSLFNSIDEGFCLVQMLFDPMGRPYDYRFLEVNTAFEVQTGLVNVLGKTARELVPEHEDYWFEAYGNVALTGEPTRFENLAEQLDGRYYDVYSFRIGEPHERKVAILFKDITDRKRREKMALLLAEIASDFARLSTPEDIMQVAGAKMSEYLDIAACNFGVVDESQSTLTINYEWRDSKAPNLLRTYDLNEYVTDAFGATCRAGQMMVVRDTQNDSRTHADHYAALNIHAFVTVPHLHHGEWRSFVSVIDTKPRNWRKDELDLIQELAARIFPRLERARAEAALRDSEARLSLELADAKRLQHISTQLMQEDDVNQLYEQILDAAIALMHADMGSLQSLDPERGALHLMHSRGFHPDSAAYWEWVGYDSHASCGIALTTGDRVIVPDIDSCDLIVGTEDHPIFQKSNIRAVQTTPLISRNGRLVGMISTHWCKPYHPSERELNLFDVLARQAADLVEQRQAEIALQESEERLRRAIAIETVGIVFFDLKGPITEANEAFLHMSGYSHADIEAGQLNWSGLTPAEHWETALKAFAELETTGRTTPYEKELIRKDGSRWWGLCAATSLNSSEVVQFIVDISDRKQAEQAREKWAQELNQLNQRLEQLTGDLSERNQELNQFAYIVSHDLKAPLRGARNLAEWLQEDLEGQIPPDNQEQLQLMVRQVDRMDALISDLLEYSRAGRTNQQVELVDVGNMVEELKLAWALPPEIKLRFTTPTPTFDARRLNLEQVLSNLIGNAIKYGCENQQGEVTIAIQEHPDWYEFAIADKGPGIEPMYHERIFGVFETLQPKADTGSTGIGLAIVKKLIEAEGGSIWVDSQPGAGATFYFTWPKAPHP